MSTASTPTFPDHPDWTPYQRTATICAVAGLVALLALGGLNYTMASGHEVEAAKGQFFLSYLVGFTFWASLPLGGLSLLFMHYLIKTSWGVLLMRPLQAATRTLPLLFVLFLPLILSLTLGAASPYWWVAPQQTMVSPAMDKAAERVSEFDKNPVPTNKPSSNDYYLTLKKKAVEHELHDRQEGTFGFLSLPMFIGVGVVLFAIWGAFAYCVLKWGQDMEEDPAKVDVSLEKLKNISGPGLILYALTITAAATQWVMSLEPSWASTMFPVIFAVNQFLTCFAFCLALFLTLAFRPPLKDYLRDKFQLDMGTLLLAFTLFWSYTSFSQLMLVWIGNLPEEIPFYLKRSAGGWWWVSAGLIALHFALPFLLLLFRDIKLNPVKLRAVAVYLLIICAIDVAWWIEPAIPHEGNYLFWLMDVAAIVGVGGVWGLAFLHHLKKRPLLPANELFWLPEGHAHESH